MTFSTHPIWDQIFIQLANPDTSEVCINGFDEIFVRQGGVSTRLNISFASPRDYEESIAAELTPKMQVEEPYDQARYIYEGKLVYNTNDGELVQSRCHIGLPPLVSTPQITMTRRSESLTTLKYIARTGSMSEDMYHFLVASVKAGLNIVLSGSSGSGKTCMLGAMAEYFDADKRIGVAEDIPELVLPTPNTTYWCSYPEKPGRSRDEVATLEFVVKQFQRNRCDQLIVGETRGSEFFSFLTAANSGLLGCMTTLHADNPVEALAKMTQFATQGAPTLPVLAINQKIATSVDLVIQLSRSNGRYRTTHIQEVVPVVGSTAEAKITTATLYAWDDQTDTFYKDATVSDGMRQRFANAGIDLTPFHISVPSGKRVPAMGGGVEVPAKPPTRPVARPRRTI